MTAACGAPDLTGRMHCDRPVDHAGRHAITLDEDDSPHTYVWGPSHHGDRRRVRRCIELTLSVEALAELARRGRTAGSRSAAVEAWLLSPERRESGR